MSQTMTEQLAPHNMKPNLYRYALLTERLWLKRQREGWTKISDEKRSRETMYLCCIRK